jgi:phage terminase large subunit
MSEDLKTRIAKLVVACKDAPHLFNTAILGRPPYWERQLDMCKLVLRHRTAVIVSGNSLGKSYWLSGMALWWLYTRPRSLVISTAPTHTQLSSVLWKYIRSAHANSRIPLGGRVTQGINVSPQTLRLSDDWACYGISSTATEKMSGYHSPNLLVIGDEASGISESVYEALDSLVYKKAILVGNPLRNYGRMYDLYHKALVMPGSDIGTMRISSFESPDINNATSSIGLANKDWLEDMRGKYGEGSLWWRTHVLAEFPDSSEDTLVPSHWLDLCDCRPVRGGPTRIAIDIAGGDGGDRTVIVVRDDNCLLEMSASNTWSFEETATRVASYAKIHTVHPGRIIYDQTGIGADFGNRLGGVGLIGCRGFMGAKGAKLRTFGNLRSASGWAMRRRLDPDRFDGKPQSGEKIHQQQFSIPREILSQIREEFAGVRYFLNKSGGIQLESKERYKERLGKSPDLFDACLISFAFSD